MRNAQKIALWADQLRHLSAMGLHFSENPYDRRNYEQIQEIAMNMMALATADSLEQLQALSAGAFRRPTPIVTGDAAIIDDDGRILLIRRADNGKWAMPGGAMEVGETPAEGVMREALEETGVHCEIVALAGVHDSRRIGAETPHHLYMLSFLCRPLSGADLQSAPLTAGEILDRRWFAEAGLPENVDPGHDTRISQAFQVWRGAARAGYDR
jgi:ADP-ribose pyrophosphatase YjhB (NUDIX family)